MNIKSLLLGSAAAMVAVSGAQAADAIVVEPEPVEYVRVCDAYGSGFFYIPGTETCIRFSGYVRSGYETTNIETTVIATGVTTNTDFTFWGQRARLNLDTRNETDWGTLRMQYRLEGGDSNSDADIDMDRALISIAGFRAGFTDNYWSTNHGYAGVNLLGYGNGGPARTIDDGWYIFNDATMLDYTWAGDGFSVTVGVEDPRIDWEGLGAGAGTNSGGSGDDVNFYAGFNYSADWGRFAFTALRDSLAIDDVDGSTGGWAYKVSASFDLTEMIPGGRLQVMYITDNDVRSNYSTTYGALANPDHSWQVAFQASVSDELQFVSQYSHAEGEGVEGDAWNASLGLNWFPAAAPGFSLRGGVKFGEFDGSLRAAGLVNEEYDGFFVSVRRDF